MYDSILTLMDNFTFGKDDSLFVLANISDVAPGAEGSGFMRIFTVVGLALLSLSGVVGNTLVCIVLQKIRKKSSMDCLILVLALADLGILIVEVPIILIRIQLDEIWPLGEATCKLVYPIQDVFFGISIWVIVTIALERYQKIVHIAKGFVRRLRRELYLIVVAIIALNFLVFSLPLFFLVDFKKVSGSWYCVVQWPEWAELPGHMNIAYQAHTILIVIAGYLSPLGIILATYASISRHLKKSNFFLRRCVPTCPEQAPIPGQSLRLKQNARAKRLLTPVVVAFAVTMLPLNVLRLAVIYVKIPNSAFRVIFPVACALVAVNSVVNPFIYTFTNKNFKLAVKRLFCGGVSKNMQWTGIFSSRRQRQYEITPAPASSV
ncbi:predicted protein [Nematostella vectensis]|uniref:G-protein coupled receptors family 1 profile domain-containing protein n=1 Tax=Nematostella vectensis TaxID=45351 RepID=A7RWW9_NEMVE|nr:somatostatin receptor type 2 [Nematostella vectensis]EDO44047.1 predicted protein [Nematostella vectensis]|eukprot:XP_001636110.1 predicted protein [Nematostella vectensis]